MHSKGTQALVHSLEALHLADSTEDENILKSFIGLDWDAFLEESAY